MQASCVHQNNRAIHQPCASVTVPEWDPVLELDLAMVEHRCERSLLAIDPVLCRELICVERKRKKCERLKNETE